MGLEIMSEIHNAWDSQNNLLMIWANDLCLFIYRMCSYYKPAKIFTRRARCWLHVVRACDGGASAVVCPPAWQSSSLASHCCSENNTYMKRWNNQLTVQETLNSFEWRNRFYFICICPHMQLFTIFLFMLQCKIQCRLLQIRRLTNTWAPFIHVHRVD